MIIVTGASRGLGQAITERLIERGEEVIGLARNTNGLKINAIECDVSDYASVKNASKEVKRMKKPVKAFINAAGVASMNMAVTTNESTVQKLIQTNLVGTIYCCQLFAPIMLRQKQGSFINFSTIAVALALKGESVYAASKAGVESFSRTFAREMADFNVRVNCIAPGPIRTDLLRGITDTQIEKITSQQVIQRQFQKSDVCDLVELLLDEKAISLSEQVLNVGGLKFMASEVERVALQYENVELAKAEAKPNPITGQHVELTVQSAPNREFDKVGLKALLVAQLPNHMMPKRIRVASVSVGHRFKKS